MHFSKFSVRLSAPEQLMTRPHPGWDRIELRAIEFLIVAIDNPDCNMVLCPRRSPHIICTSQTYTPDRAMK
jgi:hypothetical protein